MNFKKWEGWINPLFLGSFFLIFLGLYTSVTLISLGIVLFAGTFLLLRKNLTDWAKITSTPAFWPVLSLILVILVSILFASPYDFPKPLAKTKYLFLYLLLIEAFQSAEPFKNRLLSLAAILNILLGISCIFQYYGIFWLPEFFGLLEFTPFPESDKRYLASGFLSHHIHFATNALFLYHLSLSSLLNSKERGKKLLHAAACLFSVIAIFLSFSRSGWIGLIVSTLLVTFVRSRKMALKTLLTVGMALLIAIASSETVRQRIENFNPKANRDRLGAWKISRDMLKDSPLIGKGYHSFPYWSEKYYRQYGLWADHPRDPHSMYLDMLGGTGIIGFTAFLTFMAFHLCLLFKAFFRKTPSPPNSPNSEDKLFLLAIIGGFSGYLVMGVFNDQFFITYNLMALLFFLSLGVSIAQKSGARLSASG
ncbi:MAG: O-antigen ligase family protein [Deltaproteobacteria bacterium]|nr:O-antigen ligase family protein [Deltaproteobacteria bacterium]